MIKTLSFHGRGYGFNPGQGTNIPYATCHDQKAGSKNLKKVALGVYTRRPSCETTSVLSPACQACFP